MRSGRRRSGGAFVLAAIAGVGAALLAIGARCAVEEPAPAARPNVLLVTLDTTRADHTSAYGYDRPTTPRLEALARDGVRFEQAYAPTATTLPSHATLFTGVLPRAHGSTRNSLPLAKELPTLAEVLAQHGWRTAAFVSSFPVAASTGIARGFAHFDDDFADGRCSAGVRVVDGKEVRQDFCRRGDLTTGRAVAWLMESGHLAQGADASPAPFFVWLHLFDPHAPYAPPKKQLDLFPPLGDPPTELDQQIAAYDAEIHFADHVMGRLLEVLAREGRLDDTLVIVAADHGEGLMQHGWLTHGPQLYEEAVRVPFVFRWPARLPRGRRVVEPVQLADLLPTLLELLDLPAPAALPPLDGQSLVAALTGAGRLDPRRPMLLQRRSYESGSDGELAIRGEKYGVRIGDHKYIEAEEENQYELYDLSRDPGETRNLASDAPALLAPLAAALDAWIAKPLAPHAASALSEEDAQKLEALGYAR
jgi:arylsulfatase A-like enzyme